MSRAAALLARDDMKVEPRCVSRIIDHGHRTEKCVVLLHGFTSCPQQWSLIARALAREGNSVVVPRLPGHGMADRLTDAPSDVHPEDLKTAGDEAVDIAAGLGEQVTVMGLSGGGAVAAWLASHRDDVAEAVLVAPMIVPKVVPEVLAGPLSKFPEHGVDIYLWWDPRRREELATPPYAYPRYSVRTLAALLAVGHEAATITREVPLQRLTTITNDNDSAVNNHAIAELVESLAVIALERVELVFGADRGLKHDIIDPEGENGARIEEIYGEIGPYLGLAALADEVGGFPLP